MATMKIPIGRIIVAEQSANISPIMLFPRQHKVNDNLFIFYLSHRIASVIPETRVRRVRPEGAGWD
jgi:hypothetical protein